MFSIGMIMLAFMLSTILNTERIAYAVSFLFLLAGVVMQVILTNVFAVYLIFYPEQMAFWVFLYQYKQHIDSL